MRDRGRIKKREEKVATLQEEKKDNVASVEGKTSVAEERKRESRAERAARFAAAFDKRFNRG